MRNLMAIALLVLVIVVPVSAFSPRDSNWGSVSVTAIAWSDGDELTVAIANTNNNRAAITISTPTTDSRGRPVFASLMMEAPCRSIVEETFYPSAPRWNERITVQISEGYRSTDIPVQTTTIMDPDSYVVPASSHWKVSVDLESLLQDGSRTRIVVDDYYQTADGYNQDRIRIESLTGGLSQMRGNSNTIEYARPSMVLTMKAPQTSMVTTMTFDIRKTDGSSWRDEVFEGPFVMVYGRNMRYLGSFSSSGSSGQTSR